MKFNLWLEFYNNTNRAIRSELVGISDKVHEDLLKSILICLNNVRDVGVNLSF
jgi:hypothetical protein